MIAVWVFTLIYKKGRINKRESENRHVLRVRLGISGVVGVFLEIYISLESDKERYNYLDRRQDQKKGQR